MNINNIPINAGKTQLITINERDYKQKKITNKIINQYKQKLLFKQQLNKNGYYDKNNVFIINDYEYDNNELYDDNLYDYRNHQFYIQNKIIIKKNTFKLLGCIFDKDWSFNQQIQKVISSMIMIRIKTLSLINSNDNNINMNTVKQLIISTSLQLINYAGNIYLNQCNDINKLKVEYNKNINLINSKSWTTSIESRLNFNGFISFKSLIMKLNAKSFSKYIRNNKFNPNCKNKKNSINKLLKWNNSLTDIYMLNGREFDKNDKLQFVPYEKKYNILWRWYIDSKCIETNDYKLCKYGNVININHQEFIPNTLPNYIKFVNFINDWNDDEMNYHDLYIFIDGSNMFKNKDPRSRIHGFGGGALRIYYKKKCIYTMIIPISTRTHINNMELMMFKYAFEWIQCSEHSLFDISNNNNNIIKNNGYKWKIKINNNNIIIISKKSNKINNINLSLVNKIHIISDSQNCINILKQENYPSDDIAINIHKKICLLLNNLNIINKKIIEYEETRNQYPQIKFRIWRHPPSTTNRAARMDGYICTTKVHQDCILNFNKRKTRNDKTKSSSSSTTQNNRYC